VASKQPTQASYVPAIRQERVNEVLSEVSQLKDKQEDMDTKLDTMKKENEALWREVVSLRQKHASQQKIVNKLIQFLMSVVQPRMGNAVKRRYQPQLAIEDSAGQR
jgi:heat shock transcription factor 1